MSEQYLIVNHLNTQQITNIFSKIIVDKSTGCWNWTGAKTGKIGHKYGSYGLSLGNGKVTTMYTHRVLYAWLLGPIPKGRNRKTKQLDHLCKNKLCCNPVHLELVLPLVNNHRGDNCRATETHCANGHPWTIFNKLYDKPHKTGLRCRDCGIIRSIRRYKSIKNAK